MRFLIKTAFWFAVVLVFLPFFDDDADKALENAPQVETMDAVLAAAGAINYMTKICADRPAVCEKGGEALNALGYRAKEGARVAYKLIDENLGDTTVTQVKDAAVAAVAKTSADPITTATVIPIPTARPDPSN
ncbi:DUF5330 domain-containing protein [Rhizobium sp. L1K21]|uniref:DUF5330 domain-containing protein n=1 Tax=Rhizobium sp. L1K21 TaxID=2954933 RepID=UPI0020920565|nr:DUF5330 domain-containing protein [Rhizobium sp. L1K21]MCO6186722.1 DUF5330 domain-containing protein [Rhizobium sp. L1K21]